MARLLLLLALIVVCGCAGAPTVRGDRDRLPDPFTFELRAYSRSRSVYYVLSADGRLHYGGAGQANMRQATHDAGILTESQRVELWRMVLDFGLLDARGRMFPKEERVEYEVTIRAGPRDNHFTTADDDVPGLDRIDRMLFEIQSKNRYSSSPEPAQPKESNR